MILELFLNFSDSEPGYSFKLYSYKKVCSYQNSPSLRKQSTTTISNYSQIELINIKSSHTDAFI